MSRAVAEALWGADAVQAALAGDPEPVTVALALEVEAHARRGSATDFARWALSLPWPRFCAVVRVASGATLRELATKGTN